MPDAAVSGFLVNPLHPNAAADTEEFSRRARARLKDVRRGAAPSFVVPGRDPSKRPRQVARLTGPSEAHTMNGKAMPPCQR